MWSRYISVCRVRQDFEAVWRIVSRCAEGRVYPADVMRAVTGEMSENRKAIFLKVINQPPEDALELCDLLSFHSGHLLLF